MLNGFSGLVGSGSRSSGRPSPDSASLRERLFGGLPLPAVILFMLAAMASIPVALISDDRAWMSVAQAGWYLGILFSQSRVLGLRAFSAGAVITGVWLFTGTPTAAVVAAVALTVVLAYVHGRATTALEESAASRTRSELLPLIQRSIAIQATYALVLGTPIVLFGYQFLARMDGLDRFALPIVLGTAAIAGYVYYGHLRDFAASFVGRREE